MSLQPGNRPRVAAVVVSYNSARDLGDCLASLRAAGVDERIVVDNGSTDQSKAVAEAADPDVRFVPSGGNLGFGKAANLGAAMTSAPLLLISNADLTVEVDAVKALVRRLEEDQSLGLVGPLILNTDGTVYPSVREFPDLVDAMGHGLLGNVWPSNPFTSRYRLLDWDHESAAHVDWVSGACFLARRKAWDSVCGFNPAYFMYMEDVDLSWRMGEAGWKAGYEPAARVIHVQGASADQRPYRMLVAHHRSMWRFATEHTTGARRAALPLVGVGLAGRLAVSWAQRRLSHGGRRPAINPEAPGKVP